MHPFARIVKSGVKCFRAQHHCLNMARLRHVFGQCLRRIIQALKPNACANRLAGSMVNKATFAPRAAYKANPEAEVVFPTPPEPTTTKM